LRLLASHFEFNGFFFDLFRWNCFGGNTEPVRPLLHALNLAALLYVFWLAYRNRWPLPKLLGHAIIFFLLFSPMVYPWYALWALVLVPLAWNPAAWLLSLTILLSYAVWPTFHATGQWILPSWALAAEWVPVILLEALQLWRDARPTPQVSQLSAFRVLPAIAKK
jgi:hypothetical protein